MAQLPSCVSPVLQQTGVPMTVADVQERKEKHKNNFYSHWYQFCPIVQNKSHARGQRSCGRALATKKTRRGGENVCVTSQRTPLLGDVFLQPTQVLCASVLTDFSLKQIHFSRSDFTSALRRPNPSSSRPAVPEGRRDGLAKGLPCSERSARLREHWAPSHLELHLPQRMSHSERKGEKRGSPKCSTLKSVIFLS